ncbi:MAG TPA: potassium channel family protein [Nitrolancea sp.]|jgi:voltage-gated potassium channel Kch|nr:potassium channel family protein [Nitrolancea sp.]
MLALILVLYRFIRSIVKSLGDPEFRAIALLFVALLASGTIFYSSVEGWSLFNSLYFSVMTLSTVGYGDYSPKTVLGKAFTMVYVLLGISILLGFVNAIAKQSMQDPRMLSRHRRRGESHATDSQSEVDSPDNPE